MKLKPRKLLMEVPPITQPPAPNIYDDDFDYKSSASTNVARTWAKFGWVPPDRHKQDARKLALNRLSVDLQPEEIDAALSGIPPIANKKVWA
jgi:uncharacterized protein (DUF1800 family)